ncbi:MAG: hypothetical protein EA379_09700 [Phycisphaerales bacterium]|nr:MAG: hypothetical protein EA379_09700 [Phycisphaerales bacterium]
MTAAHAFALSGCKKEEPPPPPPPPPPVVQAPRPIDVGSLTMDQRVQFPQERAPVDRDLGQAVADLASALARGDEIALADRLDPPARATLDMLVESNDWRRSTESIRVVRIARLDGGDTQASVGLAIEDDTGAYLTGWRAVRANGRWVFTGSPVNAAPGVRAADLDGAS